jgi:hypothetical protein
MVSTLYAYADADVAFDDAIEVLTTQPGRLLQAATDVSAAHGDQVTGELAVDVGGFQLARDVAIQVGTPRPIEVLRSVLPLRWRAAEGHVLFPTAEANLEVSALSLHPPRVQVTVSGTYDPPLGIAGELLDRTVAHRVADAVAQRFVDEVVRRLEAVVAATDLTSRIEPSGVH